MTSKCQLAHLSVVVSSTLLLTACVNRLPPIHPYEDGIGYQSAGYKTVSGADIGAPHHQGHDYCRHLEAEARDNAVDHYHWGFIFGIGAILAVGTGTTLTAVEDNPSALRKGVDLSLPLLGAALGYLAAWEFDRARAGDDLAGTATNAARSTDDLQSNDLCLTAHGAWDRSRSTASQAIVDKLTAPGPGDAGAPASSSPPGTK